jgi:hypothetical protein
MAANKRNRLSPSKTKRTTRTSTKRTTSTRAKKTTAKAKPKSKDIAESYNEMKQFEGHWYKGMAVGRSHKWYYDKGEWKEKKVTPDEWEIDYAVTKRRAGKAPKGSGVPVGTEYNWLIVAQQHVKKLNANDYSTELKGTKFKVGYMKAETEKWSGSTKAQRNRAIKFLREMIDRLQQQNDDV